MAARREVAGADYSGEECAGHAARPVVLIAHDSGSSRLRRGGTRIGEGICVSARVAYSRFSTAKLFTTEKTPLTPFACTLATSLSEALLTTPSSVT